MSGHDDAAGAGPGPAEEPTTAGEPAERQGQERLQDRRHPSTIGGALYLVVLLAAGIGLVVTVAGDWRLGVRIVAAALAGSAGARLVLPARDAGMLAVRHRLVDVGLLTGLAVVIWVLSASIPNQPGT